MVRHFRRLRRARCCKDAPGAALIAAAGAMPPVRERRRGLRRRATEECRGLPRGAPCRSFARFSFRARALHEVSAVTARSSRFATFTSRDALFVVIDFSRANAMPASASPPLASSAEAVTRERASVAALPSL